MSLAGLQPLAAAARLGHGAPPLPFQAGRLSQHLTLQVDNMPHAAGASAPAHPRQPPPAAAACCRSRLSRLPLPPAAAHGCPACLIAERLTVAAHKQR